MQVRALLTSPRLGLLAASLAAVLWMMHAERRARRPELRGVVISEVMAVNTRGLLDEDGDSSDWIELTNRGGEPANLEGVALTDDPNVPRKWTLPALDLEPGRSLLVFASGKDRRNGELHANFRLADEGEFLALVAPDTSLLHGYRPELPALPPNVSFGLPSGGESRVLVGPDSELRWWAATDGRHDAVWNAPDFDDADWPRGRGGVGFERGQRYARLIETELTGMHEHASSAYLRFAFDVDEPRELRSLTLRVRCDDGFAAFLNGEPVAAHNAPRRLAWDARAPESPDDDQALDWAEHDLTDARRLLVPGRNLLAIQLLNRSPGSKDLLLVAVLNAFAGDPSLAEEPLMLAQPSPGRPNGAGHAEQADPPRAEPGGGLFFDPPRVTLAAEPGAEVRYTLDGSLPLASSPLYREPLRLERSTHLRARSFAPEQVGSQPLEQHYVVADADLLAFESELPVVVLSTFGREVDAERMGPAHLQVYDQRSGASLAQPALAAPIALKHRGSSTLKHPKRSYAVEIRDDAGRDRAAALLGLPADSDWVLYAPYNYDRSLLRNTLVYELSNRIGRYAPRTRFVELFVHAGAQPLSRADYHGVYVLMEKIKRGPHRVDVEELPRDATEPPWIAGGYILKVDRRGPGERGFTAGGQERLNHVYPKEAHIHPRQAEWIRGAIDDFAAALDDGSYAAHIDVDSWIDHHLLQELTRNPDGHRYSAYLFKTRGGRLELGPVWDFDRAMGADDTQRSSTPPDPSPIGRSRVYAYGWWERLLADPALGERYRERWIELRGGPLRVERVLRLVDEQAAEVAGAAGRNFERWPIELGPGGWPGKVQHLRDWLATRLRWMDSDVIGAPRFDRVRGELQGAAGGELFVTLDGSDPRADDGTPSPGATRREGRFSVPPDAVLSARERVRDDVWGALGRWAPDPQPPPLPPPPSTSAEPSPRMNALERLTEFLQAYEGDPSLSSPRVFVSILVATFLGVLLGFLYRGYYRGSEPVERSVGRSFVLITPAVSMIFSLVQFSLPLSLGLLGALSFVRFRTPIKRAEDIGFILIMIGIGLSCAVGYFLGGVMLLVVVSLVCVLRTHAPQLLGFSPSTIPLVTLRSAELLDFTELEGLLEPFGQPAMVSTQQTDGGHALVLTLKGHHQTRNTELIRTLTDAVRERLVVDVYFPDNQLAE